MAFTVAIRRCASKDNWERVMALMKSLRAKAVMQPGYLTGETMFSYTSGGTIMVLSRWQNARDWRAWESNPERARVEECINRLLSSPVVYELYVNLPPDTPGGDG